MTMKEHSSIAASTLGNCLQSIAASDDGRITGTFTFAPDFPAFAGHFPGQPVLPAIVQLATVRLLASRYLEADLVPLRVDKVKFKNMIGPGEPVTVTILPDPRDGEITISFVISTGKGKAATGEICCRINKG